MNVGLIGNGYWGKILESKLKKYFNVVFIANSETKYYNELDNVEWVFIATPTETHYEIVKMCLNKGLNVFCEKPLTLDIAQTNELFDLARIKKVKLYVDNIFLDRDEIRNLIKKEFKNITFKWNKKGNFSGTLIDGFLYHDIYIMLHFMENKLYDLKLNNLEYTDNTLFIDFNYGDKNIKIDYNKNSNSKSKIIKLDKNTIDLSIPNNDPLDEIVKKISDGKYIDYEYNKFLTINTIIIINNIFK